MTVELRALTDADIKLVEKWLEQPYVARWYHHPEDWLMEMNERQTTFDFLHHFIVVSNDVPIGFCQFYCCEDGKEDWYGSAQLDKTYSIDYLIGEKEYLGRGFGKRIIGLLTETIFNRPNGTCIIVQPEEENTASCGALLSNGYSFNEQQKFYIKQRNSLINN